MSIHDIKHNNRQQNFIDPHVDSLSHTTRRVNQNTELLTMFPTVSETVVSGAVNGSVNIVELNFNNVQNSGPAIALWDITVFIGSRTTANILFPYHTSSTLDLSQWQIIAPAPALIANGNSTNNEATTHTTRMVLRNISAGTVDIILQARSRYIFNRG